MLSERERLGRNRDCGGNRRGCQCRLERADVASSGGAFRVWTRVTALVGGRALMSNRNRVDSRTVRLRRDRLRWPAVVLQPGGSEQRIDVIAYGLASGDIGASETAGIIDRKSTRLNSSHLG